MGETKQQEHQRLQQRTDELKQEHADLSLDLTPFDQGNHDEHNAHLRDHKKALAAHKRRPEDGNT